MRKARKFRARMLPIALGVWQPEDLHLDMFEFDVARDARVAQVIFANRGQFVRVGRIQGHERLGFDIDRFQDHAVEIERDRAERINAFCHWFLIRWLPSHPFSKKTFRHHPRGRAFRMRAYRSFTPG